MTILFRGGLCQFEPAKLISRNDRCNVRDAGKLDRSVQPDGFRGGPIQEPEKKNKLKAGKIEEIQLTFNVGQR